MPCLPLGRHGSTRQRARTGGSRPKRAETAHLLRQSGERLHPMPHARRADGLSPQGPDRPLYSPAAPGGGAAGWGNFEQRAMTEIALQRDLPLSSWIMARGNCWSRLKERLEGIRGPASITDEAPSRAGP